MVGLATYKVSVSRTPSSCGLRLHFATHSYRSPTKAVCGHCHTEMARSLSLSICMKWFVQNHSSPCHRLIFTKPTALGTGRGDRDRTCDLMVPNHARSHLRYAPIFEWVFALTDGTIFLPISALRLKIVKSTYELVGLIGIEPITNRLWAGSSSNWAKVPLVLPLGLEPRSSSNLEAMPGYKPGARPIELREHICSSFRAATMILSSLLVRPHRFYEHFVSMNDVFVVLCCQYGAWLLNYSIISRKNRSHISMRRNWLIDIKIFLLDNFYT